MSEEPKATTKHTPGLAQAAKQINDELKHLVSDDQFVEDRIVTIINEKTHLPELLAVLRREILMHERMVYVCGEDDQITVDQWLLDARTLLSRIEKGVDNG
jgi:hypothetical protein